MYMYWVRSFILSFILSFFSIEKIYQYTKSEGKKRIERITSEREIEEMRKKIGWRSEHLIKNHHAIKLDIDIEVDKTRMTKMR